MSHHRKKAKKVKIVEPKVKKAIKKVICKPLSPLALLRLRTKVAKVASVKPPLTKGVARITKLGEDSNCTSSAKRKLSATKGQPRRRKLIT